MRKAQTKYGTKAMATNTSIATSVSTSSPRKLLNGKRKVTSCRTCPGGEGRTTCSRNKFSIEEASVADTVDQRCHLPHFYEDDE